MLSVSLQAQLITFSLVLLPLLKYPSSQIKQASREHSVEVKQIRNTRSLSIHCFRSSTLSAFSSLPDLKLFQTTEMFL